MRKHFVLIIAFTTLLYSCKKSDSSKSYIGKGTVFVNATDPRLAEIEGDNKRVVFFGVRDQSGKPVGLTGYSIVDMQDTTKTNFVTFDSTGRYSNILLSSGVRMHLEYQEFDSTIVTISGPDSISNLIFAKSFNPGKKQAGQLLLSAFRGQGTDKNVNVKVTKKNLTNSIEEDVKGDDAVVVVNLSAGPGKNYSVQAPYNSSKGVYSVPLTAAGYSFDDNDAISKTVSLIKSGLNLACGKTTSGDPNVDQSIAKLFATAICPLPHPYAQALCVVSSLVIFACKAGKLLEILDKALYSLDPNSMPVTNADVNVSSAHIKFGSVNSITLPVSAILINSGSYDFKVTHNYSLTGADLLSSQSWRYTAATSNGVNAYSPCSADDRLTFKTNGKGTWNSGPNNCGGAPYYNNFTYSINGNIFRYTENGNTTNFTILALNEHAFTIQVGTAIRYFEKY